VASKARIKSKITPLGTSRHRKERIRALLGKTTQRDGGVRKKKGNLENRKQGIERERGEGGGGGGGGGGGWSSGALRDPLLPGRKLIIVGFKGGREA